jgi:hypothetical protein
LTIIAAPAFVTSVSELKMPALSLAEGCVRRDERAVNQHRLALQIAASRSGAAPTPTHTTSAVIPPAGVAFVSLIGTSSAACQLRAGRVGRGELRRAPERRHVHWLRRTCRPRQVFSGHEIHGHLVLLRAGDAAPRQFARIQASEGDRRDLLDGPLMR